VPQIDPNLHVYNSQEVAAHYGKLEYLSGAEQLLFERYIRSGDAILDLGVGGGRTTPYLSKLGSPYVGADYAEAMVLSCRRKFPNLSFVVADAADLSRFGDHIFDVVVMAFNGLDYVLPDSSRLRALREVRRVLKARGLFVFSSHNPRAILQRPTWNAKRVEEFARRIAPEQSGFFPLAKLLVICARVSVALAQAFVVSTTRGIQRLTSRAFWSGQGQMIDSAHGGLLTHYAVPRCVTDELRQSGFKLLEVLGDDHPRTSGPLLTNWYYYVSVTDSEGHPNSCE